jgi:RNA polymerase sigma factor (sigma-70 family)
MRRAADVPRAQLDSLVWHIRTIATSGCASERTDRQLLDDFSSRRDETAFAALVTRHGPQVLRVCRRVLQHQQDAEDAFQATWLVLAQNSGSIRKREALAGWLYAVAYRIAMKARRSAARRRSHETRFRDRSPRITASPTWDDVQSVLDEEIHRLPKVFQTAFVLCVLQGKSGPDAARELGIREGTLSSRLSRARRRLQERLARRGIQLSTLLAAMALAESVVRASLPAALTASVLRSAILVASGEKAAALVPTKVAALAAGVSRTMFLTKIKSATAVLLAASAFVAGAGSLVVGAITASQAEQKQATPAPRPVNPAPQLEDPGRHEKHDTIQVAGRVTDPDGNPVAGAKLIFVYPSAEKVPEKVWATTASDGRFQFSVARSIENAAWSRNDWKRMYVVAAAHRHGLAAAKVEAGEAANHLTLQLARDDVPVQGRILDLQGRPVAGVKVSVADDVAIPKKGDLTDSIEAFKAAGNDANVMVARHLLYLWSPAFSALFPPVTTGADGRFEIKGIGRERVVRLRIEGPAIATREIHVMTRVTPNIQGTRPRRPRDPPAAVYYGAAFDFVVPPVKPVIGVIRDRQTQKPLSGIIVESHIIADTELHGYSLLRTTTDEAGRYRLTGLSKAAGHQIMARVEDQPYLTALQKVPNTPGLEPVTVDFALRRGISVTGRVVDKVTGKGLRAGVEYFCFLDNPFLKNRHDVERSWRGTQQDGTFRTTVLPGPGALGVRASEEQYRMGVGADQLPGRRENGFFLTQPYFLHPGGYHAVVPVNPKADAESLTCDVILDPGRSLAGKVLDPDGKPLSGARACGLRGMTSWDNEPLPGADFEVLSLSANEPRMLQFIHEGKRLAGCLAIRGDEREPVRVRLHPWGSVTGRLVMLDGEPLADAGITSLGSSKPDGWTLGALPYYFIRSDREGRFRIDGLAPGLTYLLGLRERYIEAIEVSIKAGETKNLGDIRVKPTQ